MCSESGLINTQRILETLLALIRKAKDIKESIRLAIMVVED